MPKTLKPGDKRRVYDMKNAWRKATDEQRTEILDWICVEYDDGIDRGVPGFFPVGDRFCIIQDNEEA